MAKPICIGDWHKRSCVMAGSAKTAILWDVMACSLVDGVNICEVNGASFSHLPCIYFIPFQSSLSFSPFTHIPSSHTWSLPYIWTHKTALFVATGSCLFALTKLEFFLLSVPVWLILLPQNSSQNFALKYWCPSTKPRGNPSYKTMVIKHLS
jgi:hypothetical protein